MKLSPGVLAGVLAGCAPVMVVTDVRVDGYDLVLQRCPLTTGNRARSFDAWRSCTTTRQRLPLITSKATGPVLAIPTPDREVGYHRIGAARDALIACVPPAETARIALVLDDAGRIAAVEPAALADCVRTALGPAAFPVSLPETRLAFSIAAPPAAEAP